MRRPAAAKAETLDPALPRHAAIRGAARAFAARGIETAALDARLLAIDALGLTAIDLALAGGEPIGPDGAERLADAVRRRLAGEPVARILGTWEFWGLPFALSPATLVPRPDTETVVEAALVLARGYRRPLRLLDLGTGSGCILIALLSEMPDAYGIGIDRSLDAVRVARANAETNGVGACAGFVQADWCAALSGRFDLIVSNPPYIASATIAELAVEVRLHDPPAALDGGADGLSAYRAIIDGIAGRSASTGLLASDGALVVEVGHDQAEAVLRLGREAGFTGPIVTRDLAGHARVVTLRPPSSG